MVDKNRLLMAYVLLTNLRDRFKDKITGLEREALDKAIELVDKEWKKAVEGG